MRETNRKNLTKTVLEMRPPAVGRLEVRDTNSPLVFRLTEKGVRTLSVRTRVLGDQVRLTYPKAAVIANLSDARAWARCTVDDCKAGVDPRIAQEADEEAIKREAELAERRKFATVVAKYLDRQVRKQKANRTADEIERFFEVYFLPRWRDLQVTEIGLDDVNDVLDAIFDRTVEFGGKKFGGPVAADRALAQLRACFNWWARQDGKFRSPIVPGMNRTNPSKRKRTRWLSDDEIRALWQATEAKGTFNSIVRLLLLSAQRRDEVARMERKELANDGTWTIPAERYKTDRDNAVPLSAKALTIIAEQAAHEDCDLVFSTNGKTPFSGFGKGKARLDETMLKILRKDAPEPDKVTLPEWRLHDLRRTAKTLMLRTKKVRPDVTERVLGHVIAGIEGTYDGYDYLTDKREALDALADAIDVIVAPPNDNVMPFPAAAE